MKLRDSEPERYRDLEYRYAAVPISFYIKIRQLLPYNDRSRKKSRSQKSLNTLKSFFPVTNWIGEYSKDKAIGDVTAGLTVALTVIPQSLAYANLAGLPVQYGLYASFVGCFIYCLMGTSKDITLGPTAIMSLIVG